MYTLPNTNKRTVFLTIVMLFLFSPLFAQYTISGPTTAPLNTTTYYSLNPYDSNGLSYVYWWVPTGGGNINYNMLDADVTFTQTGTQTIEATVIPNSGNSYAVTIDVSVGYTISGPTSVLSNNTSHYSLNPYDANGLSYVYWWVQSGNASISFNMLDADILFKQVGLETIEATIFPYSGNSYLTTLDVSVAPSTILSNENYVYTIAPRKATTSISALDLEEKIESVTYFDGLGRAMQSTGIRAGGTSEDIIVHIDYDQLGRQAKDFLPYPSSANLGQYSTGALSATESYYIANYGSDIDSNSPNPFSEKEFEASPLNRVLKQAAPGEDWALGNDNEIEFVYQTNTGSEVRRYEVSTIVSTSSNVNTYVPTLSLDASSGNNYGYYDANELYKTITKNENHDGSTSKLHTTEEFKNKLGHVILKRTYALVSSVEEKHDTYYVYDDYGNLTYVLPPKSNANTDMPNSTELSELCYQYKYDDRNRLVEKKMPGKDLEYIIYDKLDRPVITQDANLRAQGKWLFTTYDSFGRISYTGKVYRPSWSRQTMQNHVNTGSYRLFTDKQNSSININGVTIYYLKCFTNTTYINDNNIEILTINYYDNYTFDGFSNIPSTIDGQSVLNYNNATNTQKLTKGLSTGSKVRVLDSNPVKWITTYTGYDSRGRAIYVKSDNPYLGTIDIIENTLDFTGAIDKAVTTHTKGGTSVITKDLFFYDHAGRLRKQTQELNNTNILEVIMENSYDELGQLESKGVGGKTTQGRLQTVNYTYNIRGWLKEINDVSSLGNDLFAFEIFYNNPTHSSSEDLFNGNISQVKWKSANASNTELWYIYHYDALNRINEAQFAGGGWWDRYSLENVNYDKNGNITSMLRRGHVVSNPSSGTSSNFGVMDNLVYTYETSSNKLKKVLDNGNDTYGFKDGSNTTSEFTYDTNGNMTKDANKGITLITYNHLNLLDEVQFGSTNKIKYIYDATGVKLEKKVVESGNSNKYIFYAGNYVYERTGDTGNGSLKFFNHPEGYVDAENGYKYVYQYEDHLGNIRLSYKNISSTSTPNLEIQEENNYYPFGLRHKGYNNVINGTDHSYGYGGKEEQDELGLEWLDFEARNYDPALGRFMSVDPLSSLDHAYSPYVYTLNNPILLNDPTGLSTHIDKDGNVVAVYDDGDMGVYTQTAKTLKDFDPETMSLAITEDTQKIGETEFWDEFVNPETGKVMTEYKIQIGKSFDPIIAKKNKEAQDMDLIDIAMASRGGGYFDIKKDYKNIGGLLNGKYATSRSAGNYLAGLNAEGGTFLGVGISFKTFQQLAGALHIEESNGRKLSKPQMVDIVLLGTYISPSDKSTFVAPTYGEVNYQYRQSKAGWEAGENK